MITEEQLKDKYPADTPYWRKDPYERYVCTKHGQKTIFIRDHDLVVHAEGEDECN